MRDCLYLLVRPFLVVFVILFLFGLQAQGRIYVVTDTSDTVKITSLRGAIIDANRHGGNNTIILIRTGFLGLLGQQSNQRGNQQSFFYLTISGADEDAARTGDLDITRGNLAIIGVGSNVTIDATGLGDRVFQVFPRAGLTLNNLTITGGTAPRIGDSYFGSGESGGAIYNSGTAVLDDCVITANSGADGLDGSFNQFGFGGDGGSGGGIYNSGIMILNKCDVSLNHSGQGGNGTRPWSGTAGDPGSPGGAGGNGAGIYNVGEIMLDDCTINNNFSGNGGDGGNGGGAGGDADAGGSGAGIFNAGHSSLNTCTISGNYCGNGGTGGEGYFAPGGVGGDGGSGGGISNAGSLDLLSCTIVLNETGMGGSGIASGQIGSGGGIFNDVTNTLIVLRNTLVAQNWAFIAQSPLPPLVAGDFTSKGYNLIGMASSYNSTGFVNGVNADQVGDSASPIDPLIGLLQMNGGPSPTHALLPGSPAIDQGRSFGVHTDQRGYHRPYNYTAIPNAPGGDGSDIGAFEMDAH